MAAKTRLETLRRRLRNELLADEGRTAARLARAAKLGKKERREISDDAVLLVRAVRESSPPTLMESFLDEYGLSTGEGIAFMCLAEALLRVPDAPTIRELINDKIGDRDWRNHLGHSSSLMVNASTWALMLTGRILTEEEGGGIAGTLRQVVSRMGDPVIRTAVSNAVRMLGGGFVLGRDIHEALERAKAAAAEGLTHSFDMLGERAVTRTEARAHLDAYTDAVRSIGRVAGADTHDRPGISVKLSALHPRLEAAQRDRAIPELLEPVREVAGLAKDAGIGLTIDAEESDLVDLSLDVAEALASDPGLDGWDGLGVVVQTYSQRAAAAVDWVGELARARNRRLAVRLAKGAYWDTEIKRAQELGLDGFPVFTRKSRTDVSYLACARKLLDMRDRVYPQFATHNAHTAAAVLHMAGVGEGRPADGSFEMQRLHGMGEALHQALAELAGVRCRIYAPVGTHRDLLAYLVRRLLENGANSSFVHQLVDPKVPPETLAADPAGKPDFTAPCPVAHPLRIHPGRKGARGWDLADPPSLAELDAEREKHRGRSWQAEPVVARPARKAPGNGTPVTNPADPSDEVGRVRAATPEEVDRAIGQAGRGHRDWSAVTADKRAETLERAADLYEQHAGELLALAAREAGKTLPDAVGEVREAVDFLRFYAGEARRRPGKVAAGTLACVSPWNFPLAIFTGQVAAALAAGNAVVAKPAEQTPLMAARATSLLLEAGIPAQALQLLPGDGPHVGAQVVSDPRIAGAVFTGSLETARRVNLALAENAPPHATLVAETGGINAMVVDSTALPEQSVRDILSSAFRSAGQRCSALRVLCLQKDIEGRFLEMLTGAMDELRVGDPWPVSTDVGPVIDQAAKAAIDAHCARLEAQGRLLKRSPAPAGKGLFVAPALFRVDGVGDVDREVFGPVLHVTTFDAEGLDDAIDEINASGHGLTFGLHTRIDSRVRHVARRVRAGNIYVNRNQIGAVVGSQPFGGEGLSGTGPKAGGPRYLDAFYHAHCPSIPVLKGPPPDLVEVQALIDGSEWATWSEHPSKRAFLINRLSLQEGNVPEAPGETECDGPAGESNRLSHRPRGVALCLGPDPESAERQALDALLAGNGAVVIVPGANDVFERFGGHPVPLSVIDATLSPGTLAGIDGIGAVASYADEETLRKQRKALAMREGELVPLVCEPGRPDRYQVERHVCVDTTAAGGNATLLASVGDG